MWGFLVIARGLHVQSSSYDQCHAQKLAKYNLSCSRGHTGCSQSVNWLPHLRGGHKTKSLPNGYIVQETLFIVLLVHDTKWFYRTFSVWAKQQKIESLIMAYNDWMLLHTSAMKVHVF